MMEYLKELRLTIFMILIICFIWVIQALGKLSFVKLESGSTLVCRKELTCKSETAILRKTCWGGWSLAGIWQVESQGVTANS